MFLTTKYEQIVKLEHLLSPKVGGGGHKPTCGPPTFESWGLVPPPPPLPLFSYALVIVAKSPPLEGHTPTRVPSPPHAITPAGPQQKISPPCPTNCLMMLNKLMCRTKSPYQMSKSTKKALNTCIFFFIIFF